jgi:hypothetical protein
MASNGTGLLPGQSPPLTIITSTDRSGIVLIATALGLAFALISLLIRVLIRLEFRHRFARDDIVAALAMVGLYQVDSYERQLTVARSSRCYNRVSYSSEPRKALAELLQIFLRMILYRCKRRVEFFTNRPCRVRSNRYRLYMRATFSISLPSGLPNAPLPSYSFA